MLVFDEDSTARQLQKRKQTPLQEHPYCNWQALDGNIAGSP